MCWTEIMKMKQKDINAKLREYELTKKEVSDNEGITKEYGN